MKAVLLSVKPKWCERICHKIGEDKDGTPIYEKRVEVRKTRPKLETPFKVYIYCTQGDALACPCLNMPKYTIHRMNGGTLKGRRMTAEEREKSDYSFANGKVIGEFVCDGFYEFVQFGFGISIYDGKKEIIEPPDMLNWSCLTEDQLVEYIGNKDGYGWHISNLVIYDEPKELEEFKQCHKCEYYANCFEHEYSCDGVYNLTRPPQSWCYVEELNVWLR